MNICACKSEVCTHCPVPERCRSINASRMPCEQKMPAVRSAIGMPTRAGHHPLEYYHTPRMLEVQRHAALVALQILEIRPVSRPAKRITALEAFGHFDLNDVGAPISELAHGRRAGAHAGEVENANAGKR